jgi:hypothetical protein
VRSHTEGPSAAIARIFRATARPAPSILMVHGQSRKETCGAGRRGARVVAGGRLIVSATRRQYTGLPGSAHRSKRARDAPLSPSILQIYLRVIKRPPSERTHATRRSRRRAQVDRSPTALQSTARGSLHEPVTAQRVNLMLLNLHSEDICRSRTTSVLPEPFVYLLH